MDLSDLAALARRDQEEARDRELHRKILPWGIAFIVLCVLLAGWVVLASFGWVPLPSWSPMGKVQ